jgi:glycerol-3-phosphate dehydrogenase (NAD(P)+)
MRRAAVFGTGSWGTAYAAILADAGAEVRMWGRRAEVVDQISHGHVNTDYLPDLVLPHAVSATTDPAEAVDGAGIEEKRRDELCRPGAAVAH